MKNLPPELPEAESALLLDSLAELYALAALEELLRAMKAEAAAA